VPRVAITAYHTAELAEQAIEAGLHAYFAKPLDATSFVRELEAVVKG
jgi:AmiR/NasT family two-component response regulator